MNVLIKKSLFLCLALLFSSVLMAPQAASAKDQSSDAKVTICHNGNTLSVSNDTVQTHVDHGDTIGACEAPRNENKVTICHEGNTITVSESALSAHIAHEDTIGACDAPPPTPPPPPA